MTTRKSGLGRNLTALLANAGVSATAEQIDSLENGTLKNLPIEFLQPGRYQPRSRMNDETLEELAASIRAQGIIQPIVVRPIANRRYEIIAGERRWRAAQIALLHEVPVIIKDIPDEATVAVALIENIQRENLSCIEEARALQRLMEEFSLTHQGVADAVGRSRTAVTNLLRLTNLPNDVKALLEEGVIEMGHARAILTLTPVQQTQVAREIAHKKLSVRETEMLVRRMSLSVKPRPRPPHADRDITKFTQELSEKLGASVAIQHSPKGSGKLIISYNSVDELEGIVAHIK